MSSNIDVLTSKFKVNIATVNTTSNELPGLVISDATFERKFVK